MAIGENAHYNREFFQLRHRLLRHLVERHGFSAYAMESGFVEGWLTDDWVRGSVDHLGDDQLGHVMANGITSLMGLWSPMRAQLEWMRQHNATAERLVRFYGIDLPGSNASLLPGLDAVIAYLGEADPDYEVDPGIREAAAAYAATSAFSAPEALSAYGKLTAEVKDALTAGLAELTARMTAQRFDHLRRTTVEAYERALRSLQQTIALDAMAREMSRGNPHGIHSSIRDAAIADTVQWILRREDRIVLAAHNGHVQRCPVEVPGVLPASSTMGMHLADRLGSDYLVIGTTSATGQTLTLGADFYSGTLFTELEPPRPGSLDALMAASHEESFAADLRRLSPGDIAALGAVSEHRMGPLYGRVTPLDAFDVLVHLPLVTAADADADALAHAPCEVQEAFSRWNPE